MVHGGHGYGVKNEMEIWFWILQCLNDLMIPNNISEKEMNILISFKKIEQQANVLFLPRIGLHAKIVSYIGWELNLTTYIGW